MRNLILASLAAVAIQAQSVEDALADLFTGEPVELSIAEQAQLEICNSDETYGQRCSCLDLFIKGTGVDPALFADAKETCTDGDLPEVDWWLYEYGSSGETIIEEEDVETVSWFDE